MSDTLTMEVQVLKIGEEQTFDGSNFRKRELIGLLDGKYPQEFQFEFPNDKGDLLNNISVDEIITIHYNLRSRKVTKQGKEDMFFLSLSGWKIDKKDTFSQLVNSESREFKKRIMWVRFPPPYLKKTENDNRRETC